MSLMLVVMVLLLAVLVLGGKPAVGTSWAQERPGSASAGDEPHSSSEESGQLMPPAGYNQQGWAEDEDVSPRRCLERLMHHFTYVE